MSRLPPALGRLARTDSDRWKALAIRDAVAFADLLTANSGTNIRANGMLMPLAHFAGVVYASAKKRVDFIPMRSTQNMGTGSKVYSFHGREGTLVGSIAWSADGLVKTGATSSYIDFPTWPAPYDQGVWFIVNRMDAFNGSVGAHNFCAAAVTTGSAGFLYSQSPYKIYSLMANVSANERTRSVTSQNWGVLDGFVSISCHGVSSIGHFHWNGAPISSGISTPITGTIAPPVGIWIQGSQNTNSSHDTTTAFALIDNEPVLQDADLHTLYKSTLGKGLGLP